MKTSGSWRRPSLRVAVLAEWSILSSLAVAPMAGLFDLRWYYAAAQRLNDGHRLYSLSPGDLYVPVSTMDPIAQYPTVLPYPPLIGVIWRPLEALGQAGIFIWLAAMLAAMLIAGIVLFRRSPIVTAMVAPGLGYLFGSGNVVGFLFAALVLAWFYRDRWWVAALFGVLAAIKIYPLVFFFVLVADRNWRSCAALVVALIVAILVAILGAGLEPTLEYPGIAASMGTGWLTPGLLVAGSLATALLRGPRAYQMAIITLVIPAGFHIAGGSLIGLLAFGPGVSIGLTRPEQRV